MFEITPGLTRAQRFAALLLLALAAGPVAAVSIGSVDAGFPATVAFDGAEDAAAHAVALQPDGRILVAGHAGSDDDWQLAIARLLPNGALDPQFSGDGRLVLPLANDVQSIGSWIRPLPDGRIVVVASLLEADGSAVGLAVLRLMPGGAPDTSFSLDGRLLLPSTTVRCSIVGMCTAALLDDGHLVIAGLLVNDADIDPGVFLFKLRPDGSTDTSFGDDGYAIVQHLPSASAVAIQSTALALHVRDDGKLLLAVGTRTGDAHGVGVFQLRANGTPDTAFANGPAGIIDTGFDLSPWINSIHVGHDGRITVGMSLLSTIGAGASFGAARFLPGGLPDTGFGTGGVAALMPSPECVEFGYVCLSWAMHVDNVGRPHLVGEAARPPVGNQRNSDMAIGRFTTDGQLDTDYAPDAVRYYGTDIFGGGGVPLLNEDSGHAVVQDGAGRLVIAGQRDGIDGDTMQVWRIHTEEMFADTFE